MPTCRGSLLLAISCLAFLFGNGTKVLSSDIDAGFNFGAGFDGQVIAIARDKQGRLLVGGRFNSYNGVTRRKIVRLLPSGEVDRSFDPGAGPATGFTWDPGYVSAIVITSDGSIFVKGWFATFDGHAVNDIARLDDDGSVDTSFAINYGNPFRNSIGTPFLDREERLLVTGNFTNLQGVAVTNIARLYLDGQVDADFQPEVSGTLQMLQTYADGRMLLAIHEINPEGAKSIELIRLDAEGKRDTSFSNPLEYGELGVVRVQPDGKILAAHVNAFKRTVLKRFAPDGSPDLEFAAPSVIDGVVYALDLQSDGKIIVGGSTSVANTPLERGLIRLHPSGEQDELYPSSRGPSHSPQVSAVLVLPDDRVIFGGLFTQVDNLPHNRIAAFLANSPVPAKPVITVFSSGGTLNFQLQTLRNGIYSLQASYNFTDWETISSMIGIGSGARFWEVMNTNRFYRIHVEPR